MVKISFWLGVASISFFLIFQYGAYAECRNLEPRSTEQGTHLFEPLRGILEAKLVDSPSERSVKLRSLGAFETSEFSGQYIRPHTFSVVGARVRHSQNRTSLFLLAAFHGADNQISWLAILAKAGESSFSFISNLDGSTKCEEVPGAVTTDLLPVPAGFETAASVINVVPSDAVYEKIGL